MEEGDLIVLASDGLFNNMYKSAELTEILKNFKVKTNLRRGRRDLLFSLLHFQYSDHASLEDMAKTIVERSYSHSIDTSCMSPFAKQGSSALSWEFQGGKLDDITVLLAAITNYDTT